MYHQRLQSAPPITLHLHPIALLPRGLPACSIAGIICALCIALDAWLLSCATIGVLISYLAIQVLKWWHIRVTIGPSKLAIQQLVGIERHTDIHSIHAIHAMRVTQNPIDKLLNTCTITIMHAGGSTVIRWLVFKPLLLDWFT